MQEDASVKKGRNNNFNAEESRAPEREEFPTYSHIQFSTTFQRLLKAE